MDKEIELKGVEIKPNVFYISAKETSKLKNDTIYQIKKIVINNCKNNIVFTYMENAR